jgi:hypothetical protein
MQPQALLTSKKLFAMQRDGGDLKVLSLRLDEITTPWHDARSQVPKIFSRVLGAKRMGFPILPSGNNLFRLRQSIVRWVSSPTRMRRTKKNCK